MRVIALWIPWALALTFFGCASAPTPEQSTSNLGPWIVVLPVPDGVGFLEDQEIVSGAAMTVELERALGERGFRPFVTKTGSLEDAMAAANSLGYTYVVEGSFTEWRGHETEEREDSEATAFTVELYHTRPNTLVTMTTLVSPLGKKYLARIANKIAWRLEQETESAEK